MGRYKKEYTKEMEDEYLRTHIDTQRPPQVCSICDGMGAIDSGFTGEKEYCFQCDGTGVVYEDDL